MANRYLYMLRHISEKGQITTISFKEKEIIRDKFSLSFIDSFTTEYSNDKELEDFLNSKGFNLEKGKFYIENEYNKKNRILAIAYSDRTYLKEIARNNCNNSIVKKDITYAKYFYHYIELIKADQNLFNYLKSYYYINKSLAEATSEYIFYTKNEMIENINIAKTKINRYLTQYLTIRMIEIGIKKYKEKGKIDDKKYYSNKVFSKEKQKKPKQMRLFD